MIQLSSLKNNKIVGTIGSKFLKGLEIKSISNAKDRDKFVAESTAVLYSLSSLSMAILAYYKDKVPEDDKKYALIQCVFEVIINVILALSFAALLRKGVQTLFRKGFVVPHGIDDNIIKHLEKHKNTIKLMLTDKNKLNNASEVAMLENLEKSFVEKGKKENFIKSKKILENNEKGISALISIIGTILAYNVFSVFTKNLFATFVRKNRSNIEIKTSKKTCFNWNDQHQNWKNSHQEFAGFLAGKNK